MDDNTGHLRSSGVTAEQFIQREWPELVKRVSHQEAQNARMEALLTNIADEVRQLGNRVNAPTKITEWLSLAVAVVVLTGSIGWSNLSPVKGETEKNSDRIDRLAQIAAQQDTRITASEVNADRNYKWVSDHEAQINIALTADSAQNARLDDLERRMNESD